MRIKATLRWTAVLGFVLVAAGPATAQVNGAPADGQASGTAAGGSSAPNTLSFEDLAKMSLPDLKKLGASLYSRILGNQATLQRLYDGAIQSKNSILQQELSVPLSACDKLVQDAKSKNDELQSLQEQSSRGPVRPIDTALGKGESNDSSRAKAKSLSVLFADPSAATNLAVTIVSSLQLSANQSNQLAITGQSFAATVGGTGTGGATTVSVSISPDQPTSPETSVPGGTVGVPIGGGTTGNTQPPPCLSPTGNGC
jgi:hypothetical protein